MNIIILVLLYMVVKKKSKVNLILWLILRIRQG